MSAGQVILAVLSEAKQKFGDEYSSRNPAVIAFVKQRVADILSGKSEPAKAYEPRDFKKAQAGD